MESITIDDIDRMVAEKYPRTDLERRGCAIEIALRDEARKAYREKLMKQNEQRAEK